MFNLKSKPDIVQQAPQEDFSSHQYKELIAGFKEYLNHSKIEKSPQELKKLSDDEFNELMNSFPFAQLLFPPEDTPGIMRFLPVINSVVLFIALLILIFK